MALVWSTVIFRRKAHWFLDELAAMMSWVGVTPSIP